jgi:hypothetical protein
MSVAVAVQTVPHLYRSMSGELADYLYDHFGVTVHSEKLVDLLGYLVTAGPHSPAKSLVISEGATDAERLYLFVHAAAHILLGHADRPFATILEPRRAPREPSIRLEEWQLRQDLQADALTSAILWGCEDDAWEEIRGEAGADDPATRQMALGTARSIGELLPGHKYRGLQRALVSGFTRKAILQGLRIARAAYHRSGPSGALAPELVVRQLRQVYCLTELVAVAPDLTRRPRRAP